MKIRQFNQSATSTLRQALIFIFGLSLLQAMLTLSVESTNLKDANMVNVAGSLRMQSYRIAHALTTPHSTIEPKIVEFETSLFGAALAGLNTWYYPDEVSHHYYQVVLQWQKMRQLLEANKAQTYHDNLISFVAQIDTFVLTLQNYSENKVRFLFIAQSIGLVVILLICSYLMGFMRQRIVKPLHQLMAATKQIKNRQFDVNFPQSKDQEIGTLTQAFHHMAEELKQLYLEMEGKVNLKTQELAKANQTVSFLYNISQQLNVAELTEKDIIQVLDQLVYQQLLKSARLCFAVKQGAYRTLYSNSAWDHDNLAVTCLEINPSSQSQSNSVQLQVQKNAHVDMIVLESFAFLLGQALKQQDIMLQSQRMALMEERGVIARELHDSIAQSLSFLRIQCTLLKRQINLEPNLTAALTITNEIDLGVANAYKQLRELLSTFRLKVGEADLSAALTTMLEQLKPQTPATISLSYEINDYHLNAGQYIHILQIIREAVLNSIKHANASQISVNCVYDNTHHILIKVCDNGHGLPEVTEKQNHYGLNIMKERATKLQGQLSIANTAEGVCVLLHFPITKTEYSYGSK
ncbi:nitrate/nitrite two-component system sensor histidine kinase NarQ [Motilimonas sp. E26]|uniref:nitrate/nitrite two-component system sensor histidine kinase NarQ n=1 Tax=Motilimonas sp. E26 TaxID=2865674 RepID=UPI001E5BFE0B|nr:nitrate/nitrite two-component system sensor histidine kinase NarQ [Motilimonas sp. E26]MCE0558813.1 nitrate/nitrite two-component system sensor histidine kinase NarQ [Motilimonas sp. E26]